MYLLSAELIAEHAKKHNSTSSHLTSHCSGKPWWSRSQNMSTGIAIKWNATNRTQIAIYGHSWYSEELYHSRKNRQQHLEATNDMLPYFSAAGHNSYVKSTPHNGDWRETAFLKNLSMRKLCWGRLCEKLLHFTVPLTARSILNFRPNTLL